MKNRSGASDPPGAIRAHFVENAVAQIAALLMTVIAPEGVDRCLLPKLALIVNLPLSVLATACPPAATISRTTSCAGPSRAAFARERRARSFAPPPTRFGHRQRNAAPDAAARAGDDYLSGNVPLIDSGSLLRRTPRRWKNSSASTGLVHGNAPWWNS